MHRAPGGPNPPPSHKGSALRTTGWKPSRLPASIVGFAVMPQRRWSQRCVVSSGSVAIPPLYRFEAGGDAKSSMSALVCVIPTMRIGMGGRGKAARNVGSFGRHETTDSTPRIPSIGPGAYLRVRGQGQVEQGLKASGDPGKPQV